MWTSRKLEGDSAAAQSQAQHSKHHNVLFLANCTKSYATSLFVNEKAELLEGFLSAKSCDLVREERERVKYVQFTCEDVLSPATMVMLTAQDHAEEDFNHDRSQVVYLPAELDIDNDNVDDDDDCVQNENSTTEHHIEWTNTAALRESSQAGTHLANRTRPNYHQRSPKCSKSVEECLLGWYLSRRIASSSSHCATGMNLPPPLQSQDHVRFSIDFRAKFWAILLQNALFALVFYSKQHLE